MRDYGIPDTNRFCDRFHAEAKLSIKFLRLQLRIDALLRKAGYSPDQPRVPAGNSAGGQWTSDGDGGGSIAGNIADSHVDSHIDKLVGTIELPRGADTQDDPIRTTLQKISVPSPDGRPVNQINIFIGGFLDESSHIVMRSHAITREIYGENYYATYADADKVSDLISQLPPDTRINLIGHSWGGDTAARVAISNPGKIHLLVTVDPVTTFKKMPDLDSVSTSVAKWIDITRPISNDSDVNRTTGDHTDDLGNWASAPLGYADMSHIVEAHHEDFDKMLRVVYGELRPAPVHE